VVTALLGVPCGGCLVTGKHHFDEEPNSPPVILSKTGQPPIGSIVWIDNVQPEWRFQVSVRNEEVDEELKARWRVVHQDETEPMFVERLVTLSAEGELRELEVVVNTANLIENRCHQLDLVVSGSFPALAMTPMNFDTVLMGDEDDVARARWMIWEGQGQATTPSEQLADIARSCPTNEDFINAEMAPPVMDSMR
jgi:hypothetical protein